MPSRRADGPNGGCRWLAAREGTHPAHAFSPLAVLAPALLLAALPGLCADLEDLPQDVRDGVTTVHPNFGKQLNDTLQGALNLKGIELPGMSGAGGTVDPVRPGDLGLSGPALPAGRDSGTSVLIGIVGPGLALPPATKVGSSALSEATLTALVGQLAHGATSPQEWQRQFEEHRLGLSEACVVWRRLQQEYPRAAERMGVTATFWAALRAHVPEEERDPAELPLDDAFALGEIQLWARDAAAAQSTFEALLARLPEAPTTRRVSRGLLAYRIAQTCEHALDMEGALDWYLKCAEWGTPGMTGGYDVRSEGYVEAARMCGRLGRDDEAMTYYRKAMDECGQWGQAVAAMDLCGLLMKAGKTDEAIAVLEPLTTGGNGPVPAVLALLRTARLRCEQGDAAAAATCARTALEVLGGVTDAQALTLLASAGCQAGGVLADLDRWEKEPILVRPPRLVLAPRAGDALPSGRFTVSTMANSRLAIRAPEWVTVTPAGDPTRDASGTHRPFLAALRAEAVGRTRHGEIAIGFEEHAEGSLTTIPVSCPVCADLHATPSAVCFGFVQPGQRVEQRVVVTSRSAAEFTVSEGKSDDPRIRVGGPERSGGGWVTTVWVDTSQPAVVDGKVTLLTDVLGEGAIEVPVYAHIVAP